MGIDAGPIEVTSGLVLYLDAGNTKSFTGSGNIATDLSGFGNSASLINGTGFTEFEQRKLCFRWHK